MTAALGDGGWKLVGIGQGDLKALKGWAKLVKFSGTLYADQAQPELPAFKALEGRYADLAAAGCGHVCKESCIGSGYALFRLCCQCNCELARGAGSTNYKVMGGVIALDGGRTVFRQVLEHEDAPMPAQELIGALRAAGGGAT